MPTTKNTFAEQTHLTSLRPTRHVHAIVIGAGTAGQVAFKNIIKTHPDSVIISEGFWTTSCATYGCMLSKVLIACAERAYHALYSQDFGVNSQVTIDGKHIMQHVQRERDRFAGFVQQQVDGWQPQQKIDGKAKIMGKNSQGDIIIAVNNEVLACERRRLPSGVCDLYHG